MKISTSFLVGGLVAALTAAGICYHQAIKFQRNAEQIISVLAEQTAETTAWYNKYNQAVAQKAAAEANLALLKETYADDFKWIKQHMGVQAKDVKGIFKAVTETKGSGTATEDWELEPLDSTEVEEFDSLRWIPVSDSTEWFQLGGWFFLPTREFFYQYRSFDEITLVPYREGRNLMVRGHSKNPNVSIKGLQGILVATDPKKKPWGIGPSIQIGYDTQVRITPGISIQYSLIRF